MIYIKPLSVNQAWKGRRYRSEKYLNYINSVLVQLPKLDIPTGNLRIDITFAFSNKGADIDNPLKPFLDILQKYYNFNDSRIYELNVKKIIVPKGKEFIDFNIKVLYL
jgi:Holliday junction resolvase RusA-like endonuclease